VFEPQYLIVNFGKSVEALAIQLPVDISTCGKGGHFKLDVDGSAS
jgi:hypothetical protein